MANTYLNTQKLPALAADYNTGQLKSGAVKNAAIQEYTFSPENKTVSGDFAQVVYGDGPYSLEHPNNKTDIVAQMCDYLA